MLLNDQGYEVAKATQVALGYFPMLFALTCYYFLAFY
jgi:hypothetical protein